MKYILDRLKEPSSWAGFAVMGASMLGVPQNTSQLVVQAVAAVAAAAAVLVPEKKA